MNFRKYLRLIRCQANSVVDLFKRHQRAFPNWCRDQVIRTHVRDNLLHDFFSLVMGPSHDVRSYNGYVTQPTAHTPRRREHSRNLELDRYVAQNKKILISIAPGQDKSISLHVVRFNNTIDVLMQDTFPVHFLKWIDVTSEYIKLFKGGLQLQSSMNRAAREKQPYNYSSGTKSFLKQQHELAEQRDHLINHVELFKETHARGS
ncbi:(R)-mandelonitrile lyase 1-like [Cucumis melo var. makuwa]|uniref:(R)-mandelonitrile lyase 1-like n=1 Tax=Cucumis melo var. makuwa TaxID=1194695 RepID=A0A5A7UNR1_CUCMM|nr:(R)-mandelonitrile lyase 1-like [Cucumis melo var. makuwa]TYK08205.1 (R)-mandelonitrile lyase 1-like [Cucumis melo var. makuwa]